MCSVDSIAIRGVLSFGNNGILAGEEENLIFGYSFSIAMGELFIIKF